MLASPFPAGYAATNVKIFQIEPYDGPADSTSGTEQDLVTQAAATPAKTQADKQAALAAAREAEQSNIESMNRIAAGAIRRVK